MLLVIGVIFGLLVGFLDIILIRQKKQIIPYIVTSLAYVLIDLLSVFFISKYILKIQKVFNLSAHSPTYIIIFFILFIGIYIFLFLLHGLISKIFLIKREKCNKKGLYIVLNILIVFFFSLGVILLVATVWGVKTWGKISADQMIINLISPTTGTSDEIVIDILTGPVLFAAIIIALFCFIVFFVKKVIYVRKGNETTLLSTIGSRVFFLIISILLFVFSVIVGIIKFDLDKAFLAFAEQSPYIEDNFVDPRKTELKFPEEKRNLIHIYLESVENTYFSKELGGNMDENLMPDLAELTKEGYNFSHLSKGEGIGGHHMSKGATWSVASMVNMNTGLPMKVPVGANAYGTEGSFLPGAYTLGDILNEEGYNQTLMFGADAAFGGLNFFYSSHGNFKILDYQGVKNEGWIDPDYYVWWGFEDDKLYEFAKREILRLADAGKPFNFTMETADTHFPDGYLSTNCKETPYESQYANVIKYSQAETVKFIRWIQQQDFYENTTIVIIGDHLSMDENFFKNYVDSDFDRTCYSLILNPSENVCDVKEESLYNRQWAAFDMFPTILSALGVELPDNRLGLGTDLFSGEKTLFERDGVEEVNNMFEYKSDFYNNNILSIAVTE